MRTLLVSILLAALATGVTSQGDQKVSVSVTSRGGSAKAALEQLAQAIGGTLKCDDSIDPAEDLEFHVWVRVKDAEPTRAARLMTAATGKAVRIDMGRKLVMVGESSEPPRQATTIKGYDVSVAASRFVQYQDAYGRAKPAPKPPDASNGQVAPAAPAPEKCAAAHLADLAGSVLGDDDHGLNIVVVGDRLVLRDSSAMHRRMQEFLDLLTGDNGGQSADTLADVTLREKLRKAKPPLKLEETPRASILAQVCEIAGVDFVIRQDFVEALEQEHASMSLTADASVADALDEVFTPMIAPWLLANGAVTVGPDLYAAPGYRVFECGDLLKKLDAGYQKQRTQPGRAQGYSGGLSSEGGIEVVANALVQTLGEGGSWVLVEHFATRVIVRGAVADIEGAEIALKAMGWEAPKKD